MSLSKPGSLSKSGPLSKPELLAGLKHPSVFVRQQVLGYFENSPDADPEVTRHVQSAVDQFGWTEVFLWPHQVASFPLDDSGLDWVLKQLSRTDKNRPRETLPRHLTRMISSGDLEVVRPRLDEILVLPGFSSEDGQGLSHFRGAKKHLLKRLGIADRSPAQCWQQLEALCHSIATSDEDGFPHDQIYEGELLVDRIAADGMFYADRVLQSLQYVSDPDDGVFPEDWLRGMMIRLARLLRLEAATEMLLRQFDTDWDWYNEKISKALIAIGSPTTSQLVAQHYGQASWSTRIYTSTVLESIHHEAAVDLILPLIDSEENDGLRCQLAIAAASQFDPRGIEPAMAIYNEAPDESERGEILNRMFACAALTELNTPEINVWHGRLQKKQQRQNELLGRLKETILRRLVVNEPVVGQFDESGEDWHEVETSDDYEPLPPTEPIVREGMRIGRNEPCPCGSGKKYKKCCLRTESHTT